MLTLDQISRHGLEALRERLGQADMIRFMAQFDNCLAAEIGGKS